MRRVRSDRLREEVVLAGDLYDHAGRPVLRRGTRLRPDQADRLQRLGIAELIVEDPLTPDVVIEPVLRPVTLARLLPALAGFYERAAASPAEALPRWRGDEVGPLASMLVEDIAAAPAPRFEWIPVMGADYLVAHALNVAALAATLGLRLQLRPAQRVVELAAAGLLADLGMVRLDRRVRYRAAALDDAEWRTVREHPRVGAAMLDLSVSSFTVAAVLQHHERLDGSGYPQGLAGGQVHELARVLAVADVYLAAQEERAYRPRLQPHEALEYMLSEAGHAFALEPVRALTQVVNPYPVGVRVRLTSGLEGVVVGHTGVATRPLVRVAGGAGGPREVDLSDPARQTDFVAELLYD